MKNSILMSMLVLCLSFTSTAWSLTITGGIEVGDRDLLIGQSSTLKNSGDAKELEWVEEIVKGPVRFEQKYDLTEANLKDWMPTDAANVFALHLLGSPEYFLIKTGNLKTDPNYDHFLFQNNNSLSWAVLDFNYDIVAISGLGKISHVDEFGTETTPVPEPGTFVLLGAGLFGLAIYGKRRRNA